MRLKTLLLTVLAAFVLLPAASLAQAPSPAPANSPAPKAAVKTIFDYQKELGLTDKQLADIRAALKGLQDSLATLGQKLQVVDKEAAQAIQADAPLPQIRAKLQEVAAVQIDMRIADIDTSRKVNAILTKAQLAKWHEIQKKARGQK